MSLSLLLSKNDLSRLFNLKGIDGISSNPYSYDETTGDFPSCEDMVSILPLPEYSINYKILDENKDGDYMEIQKLILNKGPMLGFFMCIILIN